MNKTYVVLMRRWGNHEGHTYIAGVYPNMRDAVERGEQDAADRGGKYQYQVFECLYHNVKTVADTCGDQMPHVERMIEKHQQKS